MPEQVREPAAKKGAVCSRALQLLSLFMVRLLAFVGWPLGDDLRGLVQHRERSRREHGEGGEEGEKLGHLRLRLAGRISIDPMH